MYNDYYYQESERLIFRKLELADINAWADFFVQNPMEKFVGPINLERNNIEKAAFWIERQLERYEEDNAYGQLAVIDKVSEQLVGLGGILTRIIEGENEFEITYSLKPEFWNLGYGTEIAVTFKNYAVENELAASFISIIHKDNFASQKIALKNGMRATVELEYMTMPVIVFRS
jgi:ribosomal-protein-alanine N-acetyltransferase